MKIIPMRQPCRPEVPSGAGRSRPDRDEDGRGGEGLATPRPPGASVRASMLPGVGR